MIPSGRLWVALAVLSLPAILAGFQPWLWPWIALADAGLLVLALIDLAVARGQRVSITREIPPKLSVGVGNKIRLHLHNHASRRAVLTIQDDLPDALEATPRPVDVVLGAKVRGDVSYRATPTRRGRFDWGDLHVRTRGPLGLVWHERTVPAATHVSVYPDLRGSTLLLSSGALDLTHLGVRDLRRDGSGSEFARLRDYAQGDSVRDVAWKATARRGRPVTRVMETERAQSLLLCVDAGRTMAARVDGLAKLDHAVNAALFLAFVALRNGDRVGLVVFADGVKAYVAPAGGRTQYRRLVETLYATKPHLTYVDYGALFREIEIRLRRRSLLCVFTDFLDEEQGEALANPMRRLARRHVPLCLSVRDTALARLLAAPPPDAEVAFQHAAAAELLAERERMKVHVAQGGVQLIDVDPGELTLAAVNRYLEIKSRGAL